MTGKSKDQSLAVAYSVQRQARKNKMAKGGMPSHAMPSDMHDEDMLDHIMKKKRVEHMAKGGLIEVDHDMDTDVSDEDIIDLEAHAKEEPNIADDLDYDTLHGEDYAEDAALQELEQPEDSNEMGHLMADDHDMVEKLRARLRMKRGV